MRFIICTKDFSGLGFAKKLQDEGNEVLLAYENEDLEDDDQEAFDLVGNDIVEKKPMETVFEKRDKFKDAYWIFDMNYLSDYSDILRDEGFKVLGASNLTHKMEHEREFGTSLAEEYGLTPPETYEFSSVEEGISFLEQNEDKAYVFKPDDSEFSYLTYVPSANRNEAANQELRSYLESLDDAGTYILQERKDGIEANFEVWFYEGKPFFAFCGLENKKKLNNDCGENVGCAHDISFVVPVESRGIQETVGKLFPYYEKEKYTGFADANVIINSNNEIYFLEFCNRFGYNAHPNLFYNLAIKPMGEILADFLDGNIDDFDKNWKAGFGASITMYIDHKRTGLPIYISEDIKNKFYCFEYYKKDDSYYLAGYDHVVGILCDHDYTIEDAAENIVSMIKEQKVNYPDIAYRSDLQRENYNNSPIRRYRALQSMHYV